MKSMLTISLAYLVMMLPLFLGGCAKSNSNAIGTSEIVPTYVVENNGGRIACQAMFNVGGVTGTFLELTEGDKVFCSDGERTTELTKVDFLNIVSYHGGGDLKYEVGRDYTFLFERKDGTQIRSVITMPPEVTVTQPVRNQEARKGDRLAVRWNRGGAPKTEVVLNWEEANGAKGSNRRQLEGDTGSFDFLGEETRVKGNNGLELHGMVRASVQVVRIQSAGVSPKFRNGSISGKQSQSVPFTLID